ncbi:MAG: acetyl-CoA carboxylase carboxyltransferase subunit beta [Alphaproteobacteria bacterium]|nr:acetyl-CoA carboxylase carboxyltransferase subunit beta [Alphaproteobacteria bacterium]
MSWLTNFVRPRIRALVRKDNGGNNLWHKCPACERMIFHRDLDAANAVCPHCDHHMPIKPARRLALLLDEGGWERVEVPAVPVDPLRFRDRKRYGDRLKEAQTETEEKDAVIVVQGRLDGRPVVVAAFNFGFIGGSMGIAVGEAILAAANRAVTQRAPLIVITASGGARMQEGALSLMQMPRTTIAVDQVKAAGLPYIVVMTHPTTGGVTASFAMLGDIAMAEPGAIIGFAGARVIEETIGQALPKGFQRAEYLLDHGMLDMVVHRRDLRDRLIRVLGLLTAGRRAEGAPATAMAALPAPASA